METSKKVKNVLFKVNLKSNGILNYDSGDQKFMYNGTKLYSKFGSRHDNVSYAKKNYRKNADGELEFDIKLSSNFLRKEIFGKEIPFQTPNISHQDVLLYSFIAQPASLLRGYLQTARSERVKRTGALSITDARQTNDATSSMETFSKSGDKEEGSEIAGTTFFKKETAGEIEYLAEGNVDLMQLGFISCDQLFDRYAFNPDKYEVYKNFLKSSLPSFDGDLGYYQMKNSSILIPEYGTHLDEKSMIECVKYLFERILSINTTKSGGNLLVMDLKYKLVYDTIEDRIDSEDGWIDLKTRGDIDSIDFTPETFYIREDTEESIKMREDMQKAYDAAIEKSKKAKQDKKDKKSKTTTKKK